MRSEFGSLAGMLFIIVGEGELGVENEYMNDYAMTLELAGDSIDLGGGKLLLRMSFARKYRKADGPSVLVRPSGIKS